MDKPPYEARVQKKVLNQSQPEIESPKDLNLSTLEIPLEAPKSTLSGWLKFIGFALLVLVSFSLLQAYLTIVHLWKTDPILSIGLGSLLVGLLLGLIFLIYREMKGVMTLRAIAHKPFTLEELKTIGDKEVILKKLAQYYTYAEPQSPAYQHYQRFLKMIKPHHSAEEVLQIYQEKVRIPILKQAQTTLKQENIRAGAIAFLSPNALIQTLGLLWVSLRTLKNIAFVYGVRPSLLGNFRLFGIALENLAASSLSDLVSDEIARQLGGTLGDKVIANSADAVTTAMLNQRLGKALIRALDHK